jgi:hypothetical protein
MARKTVNVEDIKRWSNAILSSPRGEMSFVTAEYKDGICTMIEKILHDSGNYKGYVFKDNEDNDYGTYGYFTREYL